MGLLQMGFGLFEEILTLSFISEELKDYLLGDRAINKIFTLGNSEFPVSWENEIKLWTFLETRAALLLKTYKTTSEVSFVEFKLWWKFWFGLIADQFESLRGYVSF